LTDKIIYAAGKLVYLRPLEPQDLEGDYLAWINDPEVTHYTEVGTFPSTRRDLEEFYESTKASKSQVLLAIIDRQSHRHIGNVKLGPIHWVHRKATFGILIGDKNCWGGGIGEEATRLAVEYAFQRLNLNRVDLGVFAGHEAAVRCYEKVGFKLEGRFRQDLFSGGEFRDRLWMGLLRSEYRAAEAR
jgi:RimJ/RimL family protein N-acetyltransferase